LREKKWQFQLKKKETENMYLLIFAKKLFHWKKIQKKKC